MDDARTAASQALPPGEDPQDSGDSDTASVHTLGRAEEREEEPWPRPSTPPDLQGTLVLTPTSFEDPTPYPYKRTLTIYGNRPICVLVSKPEEGLTGIPKHRQFPRWRPGSKSTGEPGEGKEGRAGAPHGNPLKRTEPMVPPRNNKEDPGSSWEGRPPQKCFVHTDAREAYLTAGELTPGVCPELMGLMDDHGDVWWQTTDRITQNVHQVWLEGNNMFRPDHRGVEMLAEYARRHWPKEDLVGRTGGPGKVRLIVARGQYEPSCAPDMTTTDTSGDEDVEAGLSKKQMLRRRHLRTKRRKAREARRRARDGMPIGKWLLCRFRESSSQSGPLVTKRQPLHKSRVWLEDITNKRKTLHSSFQQWYPDLQDWLLLDRTPDPTAINNAYQECNFENFRWKHHRDEQDRIWIAGYERLTGPREGRLRRFHRTLKVLTVIGGTPEDNTHPTPDQESSEEEGGVSSYPTVAPEGVRKLRIATLQEVAKYLRRPMLACSSAFRDQDHWYIAEGKGRSTWSDTKQKCYNACYEWRRCTTQDGDMEDMKPLQSWPAVISFINGFLGGFYETEMEALRQIEGFRPEEEKPQRWWPHTFPKECRRAKVYMASIAAQTINSLKRRTERRSNQADGAPENNRGRGWWRSGRREYIGPTPTQWQHSPGIWREWSFTPYPDAWDGWTDHEKNRRHLEEP